LIVMACSPSYQQMQAGTGDVNGLKKFRPAFTVALYNTQVDVVGNHLSGILVIKKMPDSSTRLVFSNEMGFKFFDFEFSKEGDFKVYSIIQKMNKKSVLKTLRKDFELVLMEHLDNLSVSVRMKDGLVYYIFPQSKGYNYYITDRTGNKLIRMERASKNKTVVEAIMENYSNGVPDTIGISHKTFNFNIGLKKIQQ
jgi:hypothetical protein